MYRTAVIAAYDVMDSIFVKTTIAEYDDMGPDHLAPRVTEVRATVASRGLEDPKLWLWEAIQGLQAVLDQP